MSSTEERFNRAIGAADETVAKTNKAEVLARKMYVEALCSGDFSRCAYALRIVAVSHEERANAYRRLASTISEMGPPDVEALTGPSEAKRSRP